MIDDAVAAHGRLIDALAADILAADTGEILASHPGHEARVVADAIRQAVRRRFAGVTDDGGSPPLPRRRPALPFLRQEKKP